MSEANGLTSQLSTLNLHQEKSHQCAIFLANPQILLYLCIRSIYRRERGGDRGAIEEVESILSKRQYKSININYYEKVM